MGFPLKQVKDAVQSESDAPKFPIQADQDLEIGTLGD